MPAATLEIVLLFTRFPHPSEVFLQREVRTLAALGVPLRLVSLWGGGTEFEGHRVERFRRRRLWCSLWRVPWELASCRGLLRDVLRAAFSRRPGSWLDFWENLLGAGFAVVEAPRYRAAPPAHVHGVWASAPAAAAWTLWRLAGVPYSFGAHAYDLYEHGGDWFLPGKIAAARFIRTSTQMAATTLCERGADPARVLLVRRGLDPLPPLRPLRPRRTPLRIVTVARLVEKKGHARQLELLAALRAAGMPFEARWLGDGPLRASLLARRDALNLRDAVAFCGHVAPEGVTETLQWADVLVHTGRVARSGDRDGLPNALPEAMAVGTLVLTTPTAATTEAVIDGETGLVAPLDDTAAWVAAWHRLATDDALAAALQAGARRWVEDHYDARRNLQELIAWFRRESAAP